MVYLFVLWHLFLMFVILQEVYCFVGGCTEWCLEVALTVSLWFFSVLIVVSKWFGRLLLVIRVCWWVFFLTWECSRSELDKGRPIAVFVWIGRPRQKVFALSILPLEVWEEGYSYQSYPKSLLGDQHHSEPLMQDNSRNNQKEGHRNSTPAPFTGGNHPQVSALLAPNDQHNFSRGQKTFKLFFEASSYITCSRRHCAVELPILNSGHGPSKMLSWPTITNHQKNKPRRVTENKQTNEWLCEVDKCTQMTHNKHHQKENEMTAKPLWVTKTETEPNRNIYKK